MKLTEEQRNTILSSASEGKTSREIAVEMGLAKSTVWGLISRVAKQQERAEQEALIEESMPEVVEEMMSTLIDSGRASEFVANIGAALPPIPAPPTANSIVEAKTLNKRIAIAESFMTMEPDLLLPPSTRRSRSTIRMPTVIEELAVEAPVRPKTPAPTPSSKADIISRISMNVESFEPLLKSVLLPDKHTFMNSLYNKSEAQLETLLAVVVKTRTLANITNQLRHTVYMVAQGAEIATTAFLGMKTQGFATTLSTQDEEIKMILREIALEQLETFDKLQRPELRLALLFSTTLLATDSANRQKGVLKGPVPTAAATKHADL